MTTLQQQLDAAIAREDYELAARLRDDIAKIGPEAIELKMGAPAPGLTKLYMVPKDWFSSDGEFLGPRTKE